MAQDIMSTELITLRESDNLEVALKTLINHRITGVPVVNAEGNLLGVLSDYDIIRQLYKHKSLDEKIFSEKIEFTLHAHTISKTTPLSQIIHQILDSKFRRLPVVDEQNRLIGIITRRDLIKVFFYRAKLK